MYFIYKKRSALRTNDRAGPFFAQKNKKLASFASLHKRGCRRSQGAGGVRVRVRSPPLLSPPISPLPQFII